MSKLTLDRRQLGGGAYSNARPGIVARMKSDTDLDERALDWNAPSPRLRVLRRYEVAGTTLAALILAAGIAIAVGAATAAVVAVPCVILAGSIADVVAGRRVRAWGTPSGPRTCW